MWSGQPGGVFLNHCSSPALCAPTLHGQAREANSWTGMVQASPPSDCVSTVATFRENLGLVPGHRCIVPHGCQLWYSPLHPSISHPDCGRNGDHLLITHTGHNSITTTNSPMLLPNVLLSPSLISNLLYVCQLTRENVVFVEFDEFSFSVKDIHTAK